MLTNNVDVLSNEVGGSVDDAGEMVGTETPECKGLESASPLSTITRLVANTKEQK